MKKSLSVRKIVMLFALIALIGYSIHITVTVRHRIAAEALQVQQQEGAKQVAYLDDSGYDSLSLYVKALAARADTAPDVKLLAAFIHASRDLFAMQENASLEESMPKLVVPGPVAVIQADLRDDPQHPVYLAQLMPLSIPDIAPRLADARTVVLQTVTGDHQKAEYSIELYDMTTGLRYTDLECHPQGWDFRTFFRGGLYGKPEQFTGQIAQYIEVSDWEHSHIARAVAARDLLEARLDQQGLHLEDRLVEGLNQIYASGVAPAAAAAWDPAADPLSNCVAVVMQTDARGADALNVQEKPMTPEDISIHAIVPRKLDGAFPQRPLVLFGRIVRTRYEGAYTGLMPRSAHTLEYAYDLIDWSTRRIIHSISDISDAPSSISGSQKGYSLVRSQDMVKRYVRSLAPEDSATPEPATAAP